MKRNLSILSALALLGGAAISAGAQQKQIIPSRDVGLDQKLDAQVPLDLPFRDESGKTVKLGDYFGKKPVLLNLIFYKCPGVCTLELDGMATAFNKMSFSAGKEFDAVTVSINPKEGPALAADKKEAYLSIYKRPGADKGWHFLTGPQDSIQRLAHAIGYRYAFDLEKQQFAHPAGLLLLTPEGKISKYFYGSNYNPRDLRLAMVEAAQSRIGTPVDQILLLCLHFDSVTGKYTYAVTRILQVGAALTLLALSGSIFMMVRWEKKRGQTPPSAQA